MPTGPTIDVSKDYQGWDNKQPVTFGYPNGQSCPTLAVQGEVTDSLIELDGGAVGFEVSCPWHIFVSDLPGTMRAIIPDAWILDSNGQRWYVADVTLVAWGTRYDLNCVLEGGGVLEEKIIPEPEGG